MVLAMSSDKDRVLQVIIGLTAEHGYPPTYRELATELGISLSAVHRIVQTLRSEGAVRAQDGLARSLTVININLGINPPDSVHP